MDRRGACALRRRNGPQLQRTIPKVAGFGQGFEAMHFRNPITPVVADLSTCGLLLVMGGYGGVVLRVLLPAASSWWRFDTHTTRCVCDCAVCHDSCTPLKNRRYI